VTPGKEDEEEFGENVGVGHVEVVLQGGNGNIAVELQATGSIFDNALHLHASRTASSRFVPRTSALPLRLPCQPGGPSGLWDH
jgi:hypothetical protein